MSRERKFLGNLDRAVATLGGAEWYQTISGTAGRACGDGGGKPQAYGPTLRFLIEHAFFFGSGHCKFWAEYEEKLGQLLLNAGLEDL